MDFAYGCVLSFRPSLVVAVVVATCTYGLIAIIAVSTLAAPALDGYLCRWHLTIGSTQDRSQNFGLVLVMDKPLLDCAGAKVIALA
jgi:hypothetical protein